MHRAGDLVRVHVRGQVQGAAQRLLGLVEVAELDADVAERGERGGEAVRLAGRFVQGHGALGQGDRLVVAAAQLRHRRLVHIGERKDVVGAQGRGDSFRVAERRGGVVVAPLLRVHDARDGMDLGQVAPVTGGVQGGGGFGQVLTHDGVVADLLIAVDQFEVREPDAAGIVGGLGVLERAAVQRDSARLLAAGVGDPSVQAPQRRQQGLRQWLADLVGRAAEDGGGAVGIALQQARLGQRGADDELVLTLDAARLQQRLEQLGRRSAASPLEQRCGSCQHWLQRRADHWGEYTIRRARVVRVPVRR